MEVNIPGRGKQFIDNLLLDYNGTIACDGEVIPSIKEKIVEIKKKGIHVHVLTADTHGTVRHQCADIPVDIKIFDNSNVAENKREIAEKLGAKNCVCIGNGWNDGLMFEACGISMIVIGDEGCSAQSLLKADIVCKDIHDAFELILKPNRLIATLRG